MLLPASILDSPTSVILAVTLSVSSSTLPALMSNTMICGQQRQEIWRV